MDVKEEDLSEDLSMEEAYRRLDAVLAQMEEGEHSLEETFALYQQGLALVQCCSGKIDRIEKELIVLEEKEEDES